MEYFLSFLEGVQTFVSPCLLPLLPVYLSYFAGSKGGTRTAFLNSLAFVAGFTVIFASMGALAGTLGALLVRYSTAVSVVSGIFMIVLGLGYIGLFDIKFFGAGMLSQNRMKNEAGPVSSFLFGLFFALGWTPCIGTFLSAALVFAGREGTAAKGILMLLVYSAGLGIPFVASALLTDRLKNVFAFIKNNYRTVKIISGVMLCVIGALMLTGKMNLFFAAFS